MSTRGDLRPNAYDDPSLGRLAERRTDAVFIAELLEQTNARLLPVWRGRHPVSGERSRPRPLAVPASLHPLDGLGGIPALLGQIDDIPYFAYAIPSEQDPTAHPAFADAEHFADLRSIGPLLGRREGALLAYARAVSWFHDRHRFCGLCGGPMAIEEAGHARRCRNPACDTLVYPRTDPAVIVLVHDGPRCLMARSPRFPPGIYSVLAGFVEAGESLEACIRREIREEAGLDLGAITYHSSQPWPFPQSLMIGFYAAAASTRIVMDEDELEDAVWVGRAELRALAADKAAPEAGRMALPRSDSIARRLIGDWIEMV